MGNQISDDALAIIAEFDVNTPKRFLEIWNVISPRLARKLWRYKFIKAWNLNVPFPNLYRYFAERLGCPTCGYLLYCPKPGTCQMCDVSGGPYEKKTQLQYRYSLRPVDFQLFRPMPANMIAPGRGLYFSIDDAFWHAFKRRHCNWRTWYQDLRRQDQINAKRHKKLEVKRARIQQEKQYIDTCKRAREMVSWTLIKTIIQKPVADLRIYLQQVLAVIQMLGLNEQMVMPEIKTIPLDDVALWRILDGCCQQKFIFEYCPYHEAISTLQGHIPEGELCQKYVNDLALHSSALGFLPYDYPWRHNITPLEWTMRESQMQDTWTNQEKTLFMMKPAAEQIQRMELALCP